MFVLSAKPNSGDLVALDSKDREILEALDFEARDDFTVVGRRLGIGPTEMEKRIRRLSEDGIIQGFRPIVDVPRLGYHFCSLLLTLYRYSREDRNDITDYLVNHPSVFLLVGLQGEYDLYIGVWLPSITKIKEFNDDLQSRFGQFIKRSHEAVITDVAHFPFRFLTKTPNSREITIGEPETTYQLTKLEERVLKLLSLNARFSNAEIAESCHTDEQHIATTIEKLENNHIIKGYRPAVNNSQIGYLRYKIWLNVHKTPQKAYNDLLQHIREHYMTYWMLQGVGLLGDIEIEVMVESQTELFNYIDEMRLRFPAMIEEYQSLLFDEVLKVTYLPFY